MALMPRPIDEKMLPWRSGTECQALLAFSEWLLLTMVVFIFVFVLLKAEVV